MDQTLDFILGLSPVIQQRTLDFINAARGDYLLPAVITSGTRSIDEQRALVAQGRSTTLQSKHVEGRAFDVDMYRYDRNAVPQWVWQELGPLGERFGFRWGGRWTSFVDVGHFEW